MIDDLERLQSITNSLYHLKRHHYMPAHDSKEDVAAHSLSVALYAWKLHSHVGSSLDLTLILEYALVHDFAEVYAGDVNTYATKDQRRQKEIDEAKATQQLVGEFSGFEDLAKRLQEYQAMSNTEAKFVWTADKMQALIQGKQDDWRAYYELGITKPTFIAKNTELLAKAHPELASTFRKLIDECVALYKD